MKLWDANFPNRPKAFPVHYGWLVAVVGCLGMVASVPGQTIGINVFSEKLILALGLSRTNVSLAYLIGTAISGFVLPYAGRLFDRYGARRMIVGACLGMASSLCFISGVDVFSTKLSGLLGSTVALVWIQMTTLSLAFFLVRFWGQGMLMLISRNMIGKWWVAHRGKVFSIGGIVVSFCFSLAPRSFDWLIESIGWREAWWVMAAVLAPCFCILAWWSFRDNPSECGLVADAGLAAPERQKDDPEFQVVREFSLGEALRSYSFWAFTLVFALQSCYFTGYSFHVIDVAHDMGVSKGWILGLFVPTAFLSSGVSLFVGWACDRWRLKHLLALMALGNCLAPAGLVWASPDWVSIWIVAGFGIGSGCFAALSGAFIPRFFGLKHLGAISGFFMSVIVLGSSVGPLGFSLARSLWGSYSSVHLLATGGFSTLLLGAWFANNPQRVLRRRE